MGLIVADGDFVMIHARISGFGPKPLIGVDILRVHRFNLIYDKGKIKLVVLVVKKLFTGIQILRLGYDFICV